MQRKMDYYLMVILNKNIVYFYFFIQCLLYPYNSLGQEQSLFDFFEGLQQANIIFSDSKSSKLLGHNPQTGDYEVQIYDEYNIKYIESKNKKGQRRIKGFIEIEGNRFNLDRKRDAITGHNIPHLADLNFHCAKLRFYSKTYVIVISSGRGTTGSFINQQYCYLYDITNIKKIKDYYFILDYGSKYSFGDFNHDKKIDVAKMHYYSEKLCNGFNGNIHKGCYIIKSYTINEHNNRFIPLLHNNYMLVLLKYNNFIDVIEKRWF